MGNVEELNALQNKYDEIYVITTFESYVGRGQYTDDAPTPQKIGKRWNIVKTFYGEFPANVFLLKKFVN